MVKISISKFKTHSSEILRNVKEKRARYIVMQHGRPVAAIIPIDEVQAAAVTEVSAWDELVSLGQQIGQNWQAQQGSTDLLSGERR
ncbi:MAG: type II toxin-antitoxin system Phd/YefM family antitoxin [Anaerolineales bacterium]